MDMATHTEVFSIRPRQALSVFSFQRKNRYYSVRKVLGRIGPSVTFLTEASFMG